MLRRYVEQLLNLYNYVDGIVVCNQEAHVEYYTNYRPDVNALREEEVLGRHILSIYPYLSPEESSILRVLATGEPIFNELQHIRNPKDQSFYAVNTTLPIKSDDSTIIGVVEVSRYLDSEFVRKDITLSLKKPESRRANRKLYTLEDIYTTSTSMFKIRERIRKLGDTHSAVMIQGETGTGKELIAQAIHSHGSRRAGPFISQNCAAIPSTLLESILFGTEKGSYTGAVTREGLFELANGGTLFLDEINSMEIGMQAKILTAIEEKKIRRVGSNRTTALDVRIISAVNCDPYTAVEQNRLRKDLFFRLATVLIGIPPLRERREDVMFLTRSFIRDFNDSMNMEVIGVTEDVEKVFESYQWPGNVRELKNVIEGSFNLLSGRFIKKTDLPEYILHSLDYPNKTAPLESAADLSLEETLRDFEKRLIINALSSTRSLTEAAAKLKISKQVLNYKLNKHALRRR